MHPNILLQSLHRSPSSESAYLAYATAERVVGLVGWPMDGDPSKSLGLIAHPGEVSSLAISYDGRRLVTSGECALHSLHSLLSVHYTHY